MDPRFRGDDESGADIAARLEPFTRLPWPEARAGRALYLHAFLIAAILAS